MNAEQSRHRQGPRQRLLDRIGGSLGLRMAVVSFLPAGLVFALAGLVLVQSWRDSAFLAARDAAHAYLQTLAQPCARNLATHAIDRLDLDLSDALGDRADKVRLDDVAVYDWAGRLVARSGSGAFDTSTPTMRTFVRTGIDATTGRWRQRDADGRILLDVSVPAVSGLRWGTLVGTFDLEGVRHDLLRTTGVIAGLALAISASLAVVLGLSLRMLLMEPIGELARAAAEIRRGHLGARAFVGSRDELGRLGQDFNAMADELETYTEGLAAKVRERTEELAIKNYELEHANARLAEAAASMERLATEDGLTGIRNRRVFDRALEHETQRGARSPHPFCVVILDVDHFKHYNDRNGHPAGDRALQKVAQVLSVALRGTDLLARYGGEEFAALLLDTDHDVGLRVAEGLRRAVEAAAFEFGASQPLGKLSISVGVAAFPRDGHSPGELLARADAALYAAKRAGRNRAVAWTSDLPSPGEQAA